MRHTRGMGTGDTSSFNQEPCLGVPRLRTRMRLPTPWTEVLPALDSSSRLQTSSQWHNWPHRTIFQQRSSPPDCTTPALPASARLCGTSTWHASAFAGRLHAHPSAIPGILSCYTSTTCCTMPDMTGPSSYPPLTRLHIVQYMYLRLPVAIQRPQASET